MDRRHLLWRLTNVGWMWAEDISQPYYPLISKLWVQIMVRSRRLELPLRLKNSDLNAARLPIPPRPHMPWWLLGVYSRWTAL